MSRPAVWRRMPCPTALDTGVVDRMEIKSKVKDDLSKFLYTKTKRKPMVLPVIMNV